jgi:uncharacterized membrane protein
MGSERVSFWIFRTLREREKTITRGNESIFQLSRHGSAEKGFPAFVHFLARKQQLIVTQSKPIHMRESNLRSSFSYGKQHNACKALRFEFQERAGGEKIEIHKSKKVSILHFIISIESTELEPWRDLQCERLLTLADAAVVSSTKSLESYQ